MSRKRIGLDGRALGNINRERGIGRYTARLLQSLAQAGNDFQFVLFGYGREPDSSLLSIHSSQMEWHEIPKSRDLSLATYIYDHLLFTRAVEEAGLDLFHGIDHNMTPLLKCPFTLTVHDLIPLVLRGPYLGPTAWLWMNAHRLAARKARTVVAVSANTKLDVERIWGIPGDRIEVVAEGVSDIYRPVTDQALVDKTAARYGIEKPYLLYLGGFDPRKNIHTMLLSFKRLKLMGTGGFQMVLCGDYTGFENYLRDEVDELGLEGEVVRAGYVPEDDLPALYSGALFLVCVSIYEGFGLPLLEAMACGTPVLASNTSSIPEVVGDAGLLVDPLDPSEITRGMQELACNQATRARCIEKGRQRSSSFTWDTTARHIMRVFHRVTQGGEHNQA